jgi:AraC family transcriptional regulator of adaptative response / DNA-3-methyladenine glycosylase II
VGGGELGGARAALMSEFRQLRGGGGATLEGVLFDFDRCYVAVTARDRRFDGQFITAVRTTGIYCRPSCPATTPKRVNVEFLATAAAAQLRGYRACRRCRPDAVPGSPDWNAGADLAARAMRLITDGVIERDGVPGLAARLGYSTRQLGRALTAELGAGPVALARAHRAQSARTLIETTTLGMADVAFAAGFASVRQFNDTIRAVYAVSPTTLRTEAARRSGRPEPTPGTIALRLPLRPPYDAAGLFGFLASRAVAGVEVADGHGYARTLRLPHGPAVLSLAPGTGPGGAVDHLAARLRLTDVRDLASAVSRLRRLADLDADPAAVDAQLAADPALAASVARVPGIRLPGTVEPTEIVLRALLGQQVTVAAARTAAARLTEHLGEPLPVGPGGGVAGDCPAAGLTRLFPTPAVIAERGAEVLRGPARRTAAILGVAAAMADDSLRVHPGRDPEQLRAELTALPGVGPWTAGYILMRVLGATDELLVSDVALTKGAATLGLADAGRPGQDELSRRGRRWRPWRSYAGMHLWRAAALAPATPLDTGAGLDTGTGARPGPAPVRAGSPVRAADPGLDGRRSA